MLPRDSDFPIRDYTPTKLPTPAPTANQGEAIPLVYGTARVKPRVVFFRGFGTVKLWKDRFINDWVTYDGWACSTVLALSEAPILRVNTLFKGGDQTFTPASMFRACASGTSYTIVTGTSGTPPAWLTGTTAAGMGFGGTAYFAAQALGVESGKMPDVTFDVSGRCAPAPSAHANPADVAVDILTNSRYGMGFDPSQIVTDVGLDGSGSSSYRTYCTVMGFGASRAIQDQEGGDSLLKDLLLCTHADIVESEGKLIIVPLGDTATGSYVPPATAAVLDQDELLWEAGSDPITVVRTPDSEVFNSWPVTIENRLANYNRSTYDNQDTADVEQRGLRRTDAYEAKWVKEPYHAMKLSSLFVQESLNVRNIYKFRLKARWCQLQQLDYISLTEPVTGLSSVLCRIRSIRQLEDGGLEVEATEAPLGHATPVDLTPQAEEGYDSDGINTLPAWDLNSSITTVSSSADQAQVTASWAFNDANTSLPYANEFTYFSSSQWSLRNGNFDNVAVVPSGGQGGGAVLRIVGNEWIASKYNIPYDPTRLYKFRARARQTVDHPLSSTFYFGFEGVREDGITLCNVGGVAAHYGQHYAAATNMTSSFGWVEFVGYWKGWGATSGTSAVGTTPSNPGVAHPGVRYMRPMFLANQTGGTGTLELDFLEITDDTLAGQSYLTASNAQSTASSAYATASQALQTGSQALSAASQAQSTASAVSSSVYDPVAGLVQRALSNLTNVPSGSVTAPLIAANAIYAKNLTIANFDNLIPNPTSEGTIGELETIATADAGIYAYSGARVRALWRAPPGAYDAAYIAGWGSVVGAPLIPCAPGDKFCFEAQARTPEAGSQAYVGIRFSDKDGNAVGWGVDQTGTNVNEWTRVSVVGSAPMSATNVSFYIEKPVGTSAWFDALYARRMTEGSLLVDGSITSRKMSADAIQTLSFTGSGTPNTDTEWAISGSKMQSSGTSLLVAANNMKVGRRTLEQMFGVMAASNWSYSSFPAAGRVGFTVTDLEGTIIAAQTGSGATYKSDSYGARWTAGGSTGVALKSITNNGANTGLAGVGTNYYGYSSNAGTSWTAGTIPAGAWTKIVYSTNGLWIAQRDAGTTGTYNYAYATGTSLPTSFTTSVMGISQRFFDVAAGFGSGGIGTVVAVGANGNDCFVARTTAGSTWVTTTIATGTPTINDAVVAYNKALGQWMLLYDNGYCFTSPDAVTWTLRSTGAYVNGTLVGLAGGAQTFLAVSAGPGSAPITYLQISTDLGASWQAVDAGVVIDPMNVQWVGGVFNDINRYFISGRCSTANSDPCIQRCMQLMI